MGHSIFFYIQQFFRIMCYLGAYYRFSLLLRQCFGKIGPTIDRVAIVLNIMRLFAINLKIYHKKFDKYEIFAFRSEGVEMAAGESDVGEMDDVPFSAFMDGKMRKRVNT